MATTRTINGTGYVIPDQGDSFSNWGGDISAWIGAVTNGGLFTQGGNFTLTNDVNFGPNYGLVSIYFKSRSAGIANTGVLQLANSDDIVWAGTGAQGDVSLTVDDNNYLVSNTGFNADSNKIINLASPTAGTDAVNKNYVDANIANVQVVAGYSNVGVITGDTNINCSANIYQDILLASNPNLTFQNAEPVGKVTTLTLFVRQSANGGNTITWANTIWWSDNNTPVLSTTANTMDGFTFITYNGGSIWIGAQILGNVASANVY